MRKSAIAFTLIIFILGLVPVAYSADVAKIGIINFQKILKESSAGKMAQKDINDKGSELKERLNKEKKELEDMDKAFQREALVISPEKRKEKERAFRIRVNDFKKMQADFKKEFKILETNIINRIQKEVFDIAQQVGKEGGYMMILERKVAGVIYIPDNIDITDQVIKRYNKIKAKTN